MCSCQKEADFWRTQSLDLFRGPVISVGRPASENWQYVVLKISLGVVIPEQMEIRHINLVLDSVSASVSAQTEFSFSIK